MSGKESLLTPRLFLLLAAGSLTTMAGGVIAPVLPEMVQELRLDPGLAGNLVSAHCLTIALFSPPLGILADRVGQLRVLVWSLILYALVGPAGALLSSFGPLVMTRALLGVASGGIAAATLGLLGRLYEGEARSQALGYATSTLTITGIAFPLLGGWVGSERWQLAFWLYGLALPMALLAALFLRHKPLGQSQEQSQAGRDRDQKLSHVLSQSHTLGLLLSLGLASVAMYAVVIYAPLYLKVTISAGTVLNGVVLAARALGAAVISAFGARWLVHTLGSRPAIALGFGIMGLTLVTIPLLHQLSWILLTAVGFGLGFGIVLPTLYSLLANLAPMNLRSSVLAAGTGAGFLGQFLSPILLGPVLSSSTLAGVFYAAAGVSLIAGCLLFVWSR